MCIRDSAVIAPALHAPMPFSNAFAYEVMKEENISFSSGSATVLATVEDNNGFADISVRPAASGGWEMCVGARTWCWEAESADVRREQKETYVLS